MFAGLHLSAEDARKKGYGEQRLITIGRLDGLLVVLVWTPRGEDARRVISMRKANERERKRYEKDRLG